MNKDFVICVSNDNVGVDALNTIDAVKKAGFKNTFIQWYDKDFSISQLKQVEYIKKLGLNIEFAHLGYQNINEIWIDGEIGDRLVDRYCKDILDCHNLGINMVVMHLVSKWIAPKYNEIGLNRIKKIVEYADKLGIKIAFENTKLLGYIEYVLDNINNDNIGICFDVGHYHCNNKDNWNISRFKDKIFCVHLHDNNGLSDQHLLPLDGTINWPKIIKLLNELNYNGPITLELIYRNDYLNMNINDFYNEAYKRAMAISELI